MNKNESLQKNVDDLRPQIDQMRKLLEDHKKKIDLEMYELTLKRQRIRTYVQSLQRDNMQQREDYELMIEEEKDRVKEVMQMVEETMVNKKKLENSLKKADVAEKERERQRSK